LFALSLALLFAEERKKDMELLEAAPPDEGGGGSSRALIPNARDADDVDADASSDDSSDVSLNKADMLQDANMLCLVAACYVMSAPESCRRMQAK
jgi:hypothetical protein